MANPIVLLVTLLQVIDKVRDWDHFSKYVVNFIKKCSCAMMPLTSRVLFIVIVCDLARSTFIWLTVGGRTIPTNIGFYQNLQILVIVSNIKL